MEVVVTTGAIRRAKLQSDQIVTTNKPTSKFLQAECPSCHPTNSVKALTLLPVFTGFVLMSASISYWRSLYTELCTALHLDTCLTFAALLTCSLIVVYGRRLPANLMSARRVSSLSETVHLPVLGQSSGQSP